MGLRDKFNVGEAFGRYRIEGELGAGYTAWVYRAVDTSTGEEVALKVRKPGLPPAMQARFRLEATVLSELRAAEAKPEYRIEGTLGTTLEELSATGIQLGEDHSFIVGLRGMDLEHDPPYIALELLRGKTVIGWLMERGYLEEREALRIGWQFCHVLRLLHEDLHRSYTDMKLDNIWWDGEWIKVIDWNIVSPVGEADVGQDLLAFGKHLYRMVTGVMLDPGAKGYGADRLEVLSAGRWDELSEGMRQVLRRALHRNEGRRYPDAQALGRDLWGLARAWSPAAYTGDELVMEAWKLLDQEEDVDAVRKALALLDVARRRGDGPAEAIEQWWGVAWQRVGVQERAISRGEAFWRAGDYRSAEGALLEAIEEGEEELTAWRLLGLVRLGVERPIEVRGVQERIDEGLEALKGGWYDRAEKLFGEVNGRLGEAGVIEDLEREARVRRLVEEGDEAEADKRYSEAAEAYSGAWDELQAMGSEGYREVLAAELPDLKVAAGQAHQKARSVEEAARQLEAGWTYLNTSVEGAAGYFRRGLEKDPGNQAIVAFCLEHSQELASQGRLDEALILCEVAILGAPQRGVIRRLWQALWQTRRTLGLLRSDGWPQGLRLADVLLASYLEMTAGGGKEAEWWNHLPTPLLRGLDTAFQSAIDGKQYAQLYEFLERWQAQCGANKSLTHFMDRGLATLRKHLDRELRGKIRDLQFRDLRTLSQLRQAVRDGQILVEQLPPQYMDLEGAEGLRLSQLLEPLRKRLHEGESLWHKIRQAEQGARWTEVVDGIRELKAMDLAGDETVNDWSRLEDEAAIALVEQHVQQAQEMLTNAQEIEDLDEAYRHLEEGSSLVKGISVSSRWRKLQQQINDLVRAVERARGQWSTIMSRLQWAHQFLEAAQTAREARRLLQAHWLLEAAEAECQQALELYPQHQMAQLLLERIHQRMDDEAASECQALLGLTRQFMELGAIGRGELVLKLAKEVTFHHQEIAELLHQQVNQMKQELANKALGIAEKAHEAWAQRQFNEALTMLRGLLGIEQKVPWPMNSSSQQYFDVSTLVRLLQQKRR